MESSITKALKRRKFLRVLKRYLRSKGYYAHKYKEILIATNFKNESTQRITINTKPPGEKNEPYIFAAISTEFYTRSLKTNCDFNSPFTRFIYPVQITHEVVDELILNPPLLFTLIPESPPTDD